MSDTRLVSGVQLLFTLWCLVRHTRVVASSGPTAWELLYLFTFASFAALSALMLWHVRKLNGSDTTPAAPRAGVALLFTVAVATFCVGLWVDGFTWLSAALIVAVIMMVIRLRYVARLGPVHRGQTDAAS